MIKFMCIQTLHWHNLPLCNVCTEILSRGPLGYSLSMYGLSLRTLYPLPTPLSEISSGMLFVLYSTFMMKDICISNLNMNSTSFKVS